MLQILFYVEMCGEVAFYWFLYIKYILFYAHGFFFSLLLQQAVPLEAMIS